MTKQTDADAVATALAAAVCNEVRVELTRRHFTAGELAVALGVTPHTVGRRLKGVPPLSMEQLFTACRWMGVDLSELIARATSYVDSADAA